MKVLFTSIFALFLATSAWATGELSAPATCDVTDLGVSSGTLNVDLVWEANRINTSWYTGYGDNTQITGNGVPTSCNYDSTISLPAALSRPGYTFGGWRVKRCLIPSALIGTYGISRGSRSDSTAPNFNVSFANDYNLTEDNTWGVTWENGDKVTGVAFCSTTNDGKSFRQTGNPGTIGGYAVGGQHCWCQATHYTANAAPKCRLASPVWMFYDSLTAGGCASHCANHCALEAQAEFASQAVLFGGNVTSGDSGGGTSTPSQQQCLIPSNLVSTNGTSYGYKNDSTSQIGPFSYNVNDYNLTEDNTWGVTWANGDKVVGEAVCSGYAGNNHSEQWGETNTDWTANISDLTNASGENLHCWCKITGYIASGSSQCNPSSVWVYRTAFYDADACAYDCAGVCGDISDVSGFRTAAFLGIVAQ